MTLEMLAAGKCCVARVSIVIRCVTNEGLLLDVVIGVNEAVAFEADAFTFQLQVDSSSIDVRHLSERLGFTTAL